MRDLNVDCIIMLLRVVNQLAKSIELFHEQAWTAGYNDGLEARYEESDEK
ncbi:MAG TPA: hypothetical protein VFO10_18050 [Oligoflexus sp.]|nr:hypothetical protein [Oligoflexus sp.]HET9239168.1 hypothetical protein [Oligoflexus sp.]